MAQSGNRPPRRGQRRPWQPAPPATTAPRTATDTDESAAERARDRLAQRNVSGQKRQTASQRARSAAPAAPGPRPRRRPAQTIQCGRPVRRGSAKDGPEAHHRHDGGVFGTVLVVLAVLVIVLVSVTGKSTPRTRGSA